MGINDNFIVHCTYMMGTNYNFFVHLNDKMGLRRNLFDFYTGVIGTNDKFSRFLHRYDVDYWHYLLILTLGGYERMTNSFVHCTYMKWNNENFGFSLY